MADKKWHYMQGEKSVGPFSEPQIVSMIEGGTINANILVWPEGGETWKPAKDVFDLDGLFPPPFPGKKFPSIPRIDNGLLRLKSEWLTSPPHPWRRYFARLLDLMTFGALGFMVLGFMLYAVVLSFADNFFNQIIYEQPALDSILSVLISIPISAIVLGFTGTTIGKWFFGIRVTDNEGRPLGFKKAWEREGMVWFRGLGLGIPIVSLFTVYSGYKNLMMEGQTTWDRDLSIKTSYKPNTILQIVMGLVGFLIFCVILGILQSM